MQISENDLGAVISVHATAPIHIQRAAIVAAVSFFFFLIMIAGFYVRAHFGYFLLATAFLVVHLFTMAGWWLQKRGVVQLRENGIAYGRFRALWSDVTSAELDDLSRGIPISAGPKSTTIPASIDRIDIIADRIRSRLARTSGSASAAGQA